MDYNSDFKNLGEDLAHKLPKPQTGRNGRGKLILLAILAILLVGGASFWLTKAPAERAELRKEAADKLNDLLAETPLAGMVAAIAEKQSAPPPPPESVINPPTDEGTLAGREVIGTIAAPMDFGPLLPRMTQPAATGEKTLREVIHEAADDLAQFVGAQEKEPVVFSQDYVPPATEDNTVAPGYVSSLARWLVNHYKPGPQGGNLAVTAQTLNQECGVRLAGQVQGGRQNLLRYAFQSDMIMGLYRLYIDRFLADLEGAAIAKGFDAKATQGLYGALAGKAAVYANALEGVIQIPNLQERLKQIDEAGEKVVTCNVALTTAVFELDQLRSDKAAKHLLNTGQLKVNGATARYRRATDDFARAQANLASEIRKIAGPGLDDETLLFVASWAGRREKGFGNVQAALESCVSVLRNLANRCRTMEAQ